MKFTAMSSAVIAVAVAASQAALAEDHAIAGKAGLLGLGVEYGYTINERLGVRVGLNGSEYGFDAEESGISYDFDLVWDSLSVAVDLHPTGGPLRVSVGLLRNDNRLDAVGRSADGYTIGDTTYTPAEIGTLTGRVGFDETAPVVSVGWDFTRNGRRLGVAFDIGVVDQGSPEVALSADGGIIADPGFAADIDAEEAELQGSLGDFDLLPFAALGLVFRF
ncbi:MAG: hypothetical protein JXB36_02000 [Gammaproteobacteria bacterium]|nr:hypothetical protein [Gammaproteobacteria bacterium]